MLAELEMEADEGDDKDVVAADRHCTALLMRNNPVPTPALASPVTARNARGNLLSRGRRPRLLAIGRAKAAIC